MTRSARQVPQPLAIDARQLLQETIAQLFQTHYDALCDYAEHILGSAADAEDTVQTVFVVLSERDVAADSHVVDIPTAKYLYGAVRNRAVDLIRHRTVENRAARRWTAGGSDHATGKWHSETTATPEENAIADDLSKLIRAAIDQLPPRCRETFVLSRDHHLSYAEIARIMRVSVAAVELQMGRALKALQEAVRKGG